MHPELSPAQQEALAAGQHEQVARELLAQGRPDVAASLLEQIWDFAGAYDAYRVAGRRVDALRVALEDGAARRVDEALAELHATGQGAELDEAIALLERRRRPLDAARLRQRRADAPDLIANDLLDAGDRLGAARILADEGEVQAAFDLLTSGGDGPRSPGELALAAKLSWELGDAEGAAVFAQRCLRTGGVDETVYPLLARALGSLGHDLAAQMVLNDRDLPIDAPEQPTGRYRVTGTIQASLVGAGYVGYDRVTLEEVEIHLLLAEHAGGRAPDPEVRDAIDRFATQALGAAALAHPAIRPILRLEAAAGLLVMPSAEGPPLRAFMRPPGMIGTRSRARAMMAFLAEGLAAAHARGIVHGWLLPSVIVCDALGRPQLGPFGAHHLSGLAATYTGSLDEIMLITAPELRRGQPPTVASDLYALGALYRALLQGTLRPESADPPETAELVELALAQRLTDPDPARRPDMATVLAILRRPLPDVRELRAPVAQAPAPVPATTVSTRDELAGLSIEAAPSWSEGVLDKLCAASQPWLQPVLDRDGRTLALAPWPEGSRSLGDDEDIDWAALVPPDALAFDDEELQDALGSRLRASSLVRTPSGEWMIALDDVLRR